MRGKHRWCSQREGEKGQAIQRDIKKEAIDGDELEMNSREMWGWGSTQQRKTEQNTLMSGNSSWANKK